MRKLQVRDRLGRFQWVEVGLKASDLQYVSRSENVKTGTLPAQFIGSSREQSENTCRICPLWRDNVCYAQDGSPRMGHSSVLRVTRKGYDRTLTHALVNAHPQARYVRFGSIGDPGSIDPETYQAHEGQVREQGFGVLAYTHQWYLEHAQHLKGHALASADNTKDVGDALKAGWRVAIHIDNNDRKTFGATMAEKPQGTVIMKGSEVKYFLCPAQRTGNKVQCNTCGLCDGTKRIRPNVIVFLEHGLQMGFKRQRERRAQQPEMTPQ